MSGRPAGIPEQTPTLLPTRGDARCSFASTASRPKGPSQRNGDFVLTSEQRPVCTVRVCMSAMARYANYCGISVAIVAQRSTPSPVPPTVLAAATSDTTGALMALRAHPMQSTGQCEYFPLSATIFPAAIDDFVSTVSITFLRRLPPQSRRRYGRQSGYGSCFILHSASSYEVRTLQLLSAASTMQGRCPHPASPIATDASSPSVTRRFCLPPLELSDHVSCQPVRSVAVAAASLALLRCRDVAVARLLSQWCCFPSRPGKLRRLPQPLGA